MKGHGNNVAWLTRRDPKRLITIYIYPLKTRRSMKKVELSWEEWQRLAAITPKERERALKKLKRWVHHEIIHRGFNLEVGPFSRAAMGGDAVDVISDECLEALLCGEWHWKPNRELSSMLINIAKSKMGHIIEDYYEQGQLEFTLISDYDEDRESIEKGIAAQWKWEAEMRDNGYEIARKVVQKHPELLAYLDAMFKDDSYVGIAIALGTDVETVLTLEKKLLKLVAKELAK